MEVMQVGTSGWHYPHWKGNFYPPDLPATHWLTFYGEQFHTVEVNNSFYQLPGEETYRQWYSATPPDFTFAVKASRYITHMKKLTDPQASTAKFFEQVFSLKEKLGPILFQLPTHWGSNPERLDAFLAALPGEGRYAFEFRDPSWLIPSIREVLAKYGAAQCIYNFNRLTTSKELTAEFVYVRLHGPGGPYQGKYSLAELDEWAQEISNWVAQKRTVYCYFDNDTAGYAPQNALELVNRLAHIPAKGG